MIAALAFLAGIWVAGAVIVLDLSRGDPLPPRLAGAALWPVLLALAIWSDRR